MSDDQNKLKILLDHGVSETEANDLLKRFSNTDDALEAWWDEKFGSDIYDSPVHSAKVNSGPENDILVDQLVTMGFTRKNALHALCQSNNDIVSAVLLLTARPVHSSSKVLSETSSDDTDSDSSFDDNELLLIIPEEHQDYISVEYYPDEVIKVSWAVSAKDIDDWLLSNYDSSSKTLTFYLNNVNLSELFHINGTKLQISKMVFSAQIGRFAAASYGLYLSEEEAVSSPKLTLRVKRAHLRARQANEMLRPEGGEFKNSWESMGPEESLSVSGDIRKGLEMKLRDISDRIKAARAFHIPEKSIRLFSEASLEYVVALLDLTLIRSRKKHNKKINSMLLRSRSLGASAASPLTLSRGQTI